MHRGLQELEDMDPRDRERMMMEEIERLQHENRDLRELREYDREHMQNEIRDLRQRIDGLSCQDTSKAGNGQMPLKIKKEYAWEEPNLMTFANVKNNQKQEDAFGLIEDHTAAHEGERRPHSTKVKAATYDGSTSWRDYKAHFQTCAEINNWSYLEKGLYLAVSLRGQAQGVMGNLCSNSKDFDSLVKSLEERFAPPNQADLYRAQLKERRQKATESLSELGQDIRRLTNLAYPSATTELKETLAKDQFIDSLVSVDMRLRIKQARPTSLNDAVRHAVELEAFHKAEKSRWENQGILSTTSEASQKEDKSSLHSEELTKLQSTVAKLEKDLQRFSRMNNSGEQSQSHSQSRPDRTCYECGSKYHIRSYCPRLVSGRQRGSLGRGAGSFVRDNRGQGRGRSSANTVGPGLYIPVKFRGQVLSCLVDTGASLSVLSTRIWEHSDLCKPGRLQPYDKTIVTASGTPLDVSGKTEIVVKIGDLVCNAEVIVADIENDMLMGMDFMQRHGCTVDVLNYQLMIKDNKYQLNCMGNSGCHRVIAYEDVDIPAKCEKIIRGKVVDMNENENSLFLIEQADVVKDNVGIVARALVQGNKCVPLRIMNVSDEPQKIRKGANIANLSPVSEVKSHCIKQTKVAEVPEHLRDLYERTTIGMDSKQCDSVARLLKKYSTTFSITDSDLGEQG